MGFWSCFLRNRPSKWLTDREKLLIFMRFFLLILAFVEAKNRTFWCNFYKDMVSFVNLVNEYLTEYDGLTSAKKKSYQNRLHVILKKLSENRTFIIGGTWGQSWKLPQLYAFYEVVIFELRQNPYPEEIGKVYDLPMFSYSGSRDPLIHEKIQRDLFGVNFKLPYDMCQTFSVIFKSDTQVLNDPLPVVSKPFVVPSPNSTNLGAARSALNLAKSLETPRGSVKSPPAYDVPTPVEMTSTPREICTPRASCTPRTPRTPRSPEFSKWLLQELLSQKFLQFLQQQSQQSSSKQLKQMFGDLRLYFNQYLYQIFVLHNPNTIRSFFRALNDYSVVKTALELYYEEPLAGWMDIQIVTDSNEEDQKRFYEYLKMMIHLKVWLSDDDANKSEFSAECAGKRWVFDESYNSFDIFDLPEPSTIGEQAPMA